MSLVVANVTARSNYITSVNNFLNTYGFDGVDIEWEYPYGATQWNNFSTTIVQMQQLLGKNGKSISLALSAWGVNLTSNAIASVDAVNFMNYDSGYYHAPFENSRSRIDYFIALGFPKEKINLGLDWYGRPFDGTAYWINYREIHDLYTITSEQDIIYNYPVDTSGSSPVLKNIYYNGIDMKRRKMLLAQDLKVGGVMMWHLFGDLPSSDSRSLLKAITDKKNQHTLYRSRTNLALGQTYSANTIDSGYSASQAFDNNDKTTYWQAPTGINNNVYLQIDFSSVTTFNNNVLKEHGNNVGSFKIHTLTG